MDTQTRTSILAEARSWLYTPYVAGGCAQKGVGVDCGRFIHNVYGQFLQLPPFPHDYPEDWALHRENERYLGFISPFVVEVQRPILAGLAMWRVGRNFSHGSIVTERGTFIHAWGTTGSGCVVESPKNFFKNRPVKFFDLR